MILHQFVSFVENLLYVRLKVFRSDGGGEFYNSTITHLFTTKGILHKKKSCPYTPKKNGVNERNHRHIVETWSLLFGPMAVFLINRMCTSSFNMMSPFEKLFGKTPNLLHLKVVGCACYPLLKPYNKHNLEPKTSQHVLFGLIIKATFITICNLIRPLSLTMSCFMSLFFPSHLLSNQNLLYSPLPLLHFSTNFPIISFLCLHLFCLLPLVLLPLMSLYHMPLSLICRGLQQVPPTTIVAFSPSSSSLLPTAISPVFSSSPVLPQPSFPPQNTTPTSHASLPSPLPSHPAPPLPTNTHVMQTRYKFGIVKPRLLNLLLTLPLL